jgi:hypothetical protein
MADSIGQETLWWRHHWEEWERVHGLHGPILVRLRHRAYSVSFFIHNRSHRGEIRVSLELLIRHHHGSLAVHGS